MPASRFSSVKDFMKEMSRLDIELVSKPSKTPSMKDSILWICKCGRETRSTVTNLLKGCKCKSCASKKTKGIPLSKFKKVLALEGWSYEGDDSDFKTVQSIVDVKCDQGHETKTSYNRFFTGKRRCKYCADESKRGGIDRARRIFKEQGLELVTEQYHNNKTPMECKCRCGRQFEVSLGNVKKIHQCHDCTMMTTRTTASDVISQLERSHCALIPDSLENIDYVINSTKIKYTCFCGREAETRWKLFKNGVRCSECTKATRKATNLLIYGVENAAASEEVKMKIRQTFQEKYGGHHMKLKCVQDKAKETNKHNHGGVHNLASDEMKKVAAEAFLKKYGARFGCVPEIAERTRAKIHAKYGVDYPLQSQEVRQKMRDKYGGDCFIHTDKGREVMMQRYGVHNPMHNADILSRNHSKVFSFKEFTFPSGRVEKVQGYEHFALRDLLKHHEEDGIVVGAQNVPTFQYTFPSCKAYKQYKLSPEQSTLFTDEEEFTRECTDHVYYPDIYLPEENTIVEVKSVYTFLMDQFKNHVKMQAVADSGYNAQLLVYCPKGKLLETVLYRKGKSRMHVMETL